MEIVGKKYIFFFPFFSFYFFKTMVREWSKGGRALLVLVVYVWAKLFILLYGCGGQVVSGVEDGKWVLVDENEINVVWWSLMRVK